ncbi:glycine cleavage system protein GcvH [Blattabacterium cuenoti]|uniref:glycine cleavage system protein GcvH n=1 Tax=Blattabacterium cuenoti TaxID=1653831 RepID=UPI00163C241D|nr:glycine cleavage system protein GcvH [Blattabacterium cuenoti]
MSLDNLKYSKNHEWVGFEVQNKKSKMAYVGITSFAQKELGDIVYLDIDSNIIGKKIQKEAVFGTIEAVKTVSDLFMPVSGIIIKINEKLISKPEIINNYSYEKNWMIKIEILFIEEYDKLMSLEEYNQYTQNSI